MKYPKVDLTDGLCTTIKAHTRETWRYSNLWSCAIYTSLPLSWQHSPRLVFSCYFCRGVTWWPLRLALTANISSCSWVLMWN